MVDPPPPEEQEPPQGMCLPRHGSGLGGLGWRGLAVTCVARAPCRAAAPRVAEGPAGDSAEGVRCTSMAAALLAVATAAEAAAGPGPDDVATSSPKPPPAAPPAGAPTDPEPDEADPVGDPDRPGPWRPQWWGRGEGRFQPVGKVACRRSYANSSSNDDANKQPTWLRGRRQQQWG